MFVNVRRFRPCTSRIRPPRSTTTIPPTPGAEVT